MISPSPRLHVATESARERARALQALPMPDDGETGAPATRKKRAPVLNLASDVIDGRFVIRDYLGRGALGQVFSAIDKQLFGRAVAIKIATTYEPAIERRLITEAEVLSNVEHSGLVRAIACGTTDQGYRYLAMEFVRGDTLEKHLHRRGWLPWREVLEIGVQLGNVLQALHDAGVIHRDVAPRNAMFDRSNGNFVVKLIDLGAAYLSSEFKAAQDSTFSAIPIRYPTLAGAVVGSLRYQPEDARYRAPSPQLDVYALATMLYELCTHAVPAETERQPIAAVQPKNDAPEDFSRVLLDAVAEDPDARIDTAHAFVRRLEAVREAHPPGPRRPYLYAGSYDLLKTIAVTHTASIFRVSDRRLSCERVLKRLNREHVKRDPDSAIRFRRSGKILAALDHPNIAKVHHAGEVDGEEFLVVDRCPGQPASEFVRRDRHLTPTEVVEVCRQLASALDACHRIGVVYRDLHPGNVMIERGRTTRAFLFDFDASLVSCEFFAHLQERYATPPEERIEPARELDLTRKDWCAPEVREGGAYSAASDVYALGLLCYRLLTGYRPTPANKVGYTPPSERGDYPPSFDDLFEQMLAEDPAERIGIPDVYKLLEDIEEEIRDPSIAAALRGAELPRTQIAPATPEMPTGASLRDFAPSPPPATPETRVEPPSQREVSPVPGVAPWAPPQGAGRRAWIVALLALAAAGTWALGALAPEAGEPRSIDQDETMTLRHAFPDPPPTIPELVASRTSPPEEAAKPAPRSSPRSVQEAARQVLAGLRTCEGAPDVFVAAITVKDGRGAVASFDGEAVGVADWHECARKWLERVKYPAVETPAPERVRLQLR